MDNNDSKTQTLFKEQLYHSLDVEYVIQRHVRDTRIPKHERLMVAQAIKEEHDTTCFSALSGPVTVRWGKDRINLARGGLLGIPKRIDLDRFEILKHKSKQVLLAWTDTKGLGRLCRLENLSKSKTILIACDNSSIPTSNVRRILHRLRFESKLPVYVLTDNSPEGYFVFSSIKRGLVSPGRTDENLAVPDVQYLGVRAGAYLSIDKGETLLDPLPPNWKAQLQALKSYPCFKTKAWKREFAQFSKQSGKLKVEAALLCIWGGRTFWNDILFNPSRYCC